MAFLLYFRTTIIENNCTDIKKTVNFHVTTVVNKESFLCSFHNEIAIHFVRLHGDAYQPQASKCVEHNMAS